VQNFAHHSANYASRNLVSRIAEKNGWSSAEVNAVLLGLSFTGNYLVGKRLELPDDSNQISVPRINGILSRKGGVLVNSIDYPIANRIVGLPFDFVDIALGYQGFPTATWFDVYQAGLFGTTINAHSLGTLDQTNLNGLGLVRGGKVNSLPFGNVAPSGSEAHLGALDIVNGMAVGMFLNPWATLETKNRGVWKHSNRCYEGPCK
ncbi:MAG: hypothetical protein ACWA5Q_00115, partial [bacterium]